MHEWKGEVQKSLGKMRFPRLFGYPRCLCEWQNMRPVVGIICEYDPFHLGHRRQLSLIRDALPGARILCLMSGCFTQRGMPALHPPAARAEAALRAGADCVVELPCAFAVRDAENFALGGVEIFDRLGFVTHLCFGAESDAATLLPAASLLEAPDGAFSASLRRELASGASFAAAQGRALAGRFPDLSEAFDKPNNILALCYLRALIRLKSAILPLPVKRLGNYHEPDLRADAFPSATAVRAAFLNGDLLAASGACGYDLPSAPVCRPGALDRVLLARLRAMPPDELAGLPLCSEGLENRLAECARSAVTRDGLIEALKTKRYARARLSRLCCHALLEVTGALLTAHPSPEYVRLLGFRRESSELLSCFRQSRIPLIAKAADGDPGHPLYRLDLRAYDLWALGADMPAGLMCRQRVVVV